jgi:hypothetical protein
MASQATLQSAEYLKTSYAAAASDMLISDSSVTDSVLSLFEAGANGGETETYGLGRRDQEHPRLGFLKGQSTHDILAKMPPLPGLRSVIIDQLMQISFPRLPTLSGERTTSQVSGHRDLLRPL